MNFHLSQPKGKGKKTIKRSDNGEDSNANPPLSKSGVSSRHVETGINNQDEVAEAARHTTSYDGSKKARLQADSQSSALSHPDTKKSDKKFAPDHGSRPHGSVPSIRAPQNRARLRSYVDIEDEDDEDEPPAVTRKAKKRLSVVNEVGEPSNNSSLVISTIQRKGSQAPRDQREQKIVPLSANRDGEEDIPDSKTVAIKTTNTRRRITAEASKTRIRKKVLNAEAVSVPKTRKSSHKVTEDFPAMPPRRIEKPNLRTESDAKVPHTETEGLNTTHSQSKSNESTKRRRQTLETGPLPLKRRKSTDDAIHDADYEERKFVEPQSKKANKERADDCFEKRERSAIGNAKAKKSNFVKGSVQFAFYLSMMASKTRFISARTSSGKAKENTAVTKAKVSHTNPIVCSSLTVTQKQSKTVAPVRTRMEAESNLDYDSGPDPLDLLS
jgi:hypothetical protein